MQLSEQWKEHLTNQIIIFICSWEKTKIIKISKISKGFKVSVLKVDTRISLNSNK
jgi:hypothetical protein